MLAILVVIGTKYACNLSQDGDHISYMPAILGPLDMLYNKTLYPLTCKNCLSEQFDESDSNPSLILNPNFYFVSSSKHVRKN